MTVTIQHSCSHTREISVKGVREGRQYQKWLASQQCPACAEQAYYTVNVYKHSGIGSEGTFENIWADSAEDAMARVAGSNPWLRLNPMAAFRQENGRI